MINNDDNLEAKQKNIYFLQNLDDFVHKICQKIPFSNVLILSIDTEFFEFGKVIYDKLLEKGIKAQSVILNEEFALQLDDLLSVKSALVEFRGIVVFNKQILCRFLDTCSKSFKIFYLQRSSDFYGIFNDRLGQSKIERYFYINTVDEKVLIKNLFIRTICLMDYFIYKCITDKKIDKPFFNKAKKLILLAMGIIYGNKNGKQLLGALVIIEKTFASKQELEFFSSNVACYLMRKDYYHLQTNFLASKRIVKKYSHIFLKKHENQTSYSERAKVVSFFSGKTINFCLNAINVQLTNINNEFTAQDKDEIKCLIKICNKLVSKTEQYYLEDNKNKENLLKIQKLDMCVSVCGDTYLSINGMSLLR